MKAVLFIHGLSAKIEDNEYFINQMSIYPNIDIYTFTLPGHSEKCVEYVKYQEWIDASEKELNKILEKYKKVTIVAHSMGTIIAVNLASRYKEVEKLVLISSAFIFGNIDQNKKDLKRIINKEVDEELGTGFEGALTKFLSISKRVMIEYMLMASVNIKNIRKITCPTLLIHGSEDNVIPVNSSKMVYEKLNCKKDLIIVENVRHQVFKSNKKKEITDYIYRFINFKILYILGRQKQI